MLELNVVFKQSHVSLIALESLREIYLFDSGLGDAEIVKIQIDNKGIRVMKDFEISLFVDNQFVETLEISDEVNPQTSAEFQFNIPQDFSTVGDYDIRAIVAHVEDGYGDQATTRDYSSHSDDTGTGRLFWRTVSGLADRRRGAVCLCWLYFV